MLPMKRKAALPAKNPKQARRNGEDSARFNAEMAMSILPMPRDQVGHQDSPEVARRPVEPILHITSRKQWEEATKMGSYEGDSLATEGFIHCSAVTQVIQVANALFKGKRDLVLLVIDPSKVRPETRWEGQEGGPLFPHIYGQLDCGAVSEVLPFEPDDQGVFGLAEIDARVGRTEEEIRAYTVGQVVPYAVKVEVVDYDAAWPGLFGREADRIRRALGERVLLLEHAGSTSVPGLPAKPIIDIVLAVPDSADEAAYVPDLERHGYVLRIREPDWFQHRVFKGPDTNINLHVFTHGCAEIERMLAFRDWLRANPADRERYAAAKRALAKRDWKYVQNYADAKTPVVADIMSRASSLLRPAQPGKG